MERPHAIETPHKYRGTGRLAAVVRVEHFSSAQPVSAAAGKYVLFVASESAAVFLTENHARAWVGAGASYVCAWGPSAGTVEEAFDYASFLSELGEPLPFTLMTTSHVSEPLEEALWFAFYTAHPPDDLPCELNAVVAVVDSAGLEERCTTWVKENCE